MRTIIQPPVSGSVSDDSSLSLEPTKEGQSSESADSSTIGITDLYLVATSLIGRFVKWGARHADESSAMMVLTRCGVCSERSFQ